MVVRLWRGQTGVGQARLRFIPFQDCISTGKLMDFQFSVTHPKSVNVINGVGDSLSTWRGKRSYEFFTFLIYKQLWVGGSGNSSSVVAQAPMTTQDATYVSTRIYRYFN